MPLLDLIDMRLDLTILPGLFLMGLDENGGEIAFAMLTPIG